MFLLFCPAFASFPKPCLSLHPSALLHSSMQSPLSQCPFSPASHPHSIKPLLDSLFRPTTHSPNFKPLLSTQSYSPSHLVTPNHFVTPFLNPLPTPPAYAPHFQLQYNFQRRQDSRQDGWLAASGSNVNNAGSILRPRATQTPEEVAVSTFVSAVPHRTHAQKHTIIPQRTQSFTLTLKDA